jgi:hypothetical protein
VSEIDLASTTTAATFDVTLAATLASTYLLLESTILTDDCF